ncbi:alpha-E domain-containing protein [Corallococcus sp. AB038B]|uniref:alpha-E domain-containing protein n=1 Tax=Corallococcus sp. AB038B TaxID=2316718 RepID=UPI000ED0A4E9|nr:alpha-E domain-containing protein [Corallococcus sp. AB038B]RKH93382.1 alpha-E domain-containing protein [Corallococcus sp. AB038B]
MIARIAEHCFWLGRYLERLESVARVLQMTDQLALDADLPADQSWMPALAIFGEREAFAKKHGAKAEADGEKVQDFLTWEDDNFSSLVATVVMARDNARTIREVVSRECWEVTNELYHFLTGEAGRAEYAASRFGFYQHIRRMVQLCLGFLDSTMLHDTPQEFIWLGVMLERTGQTSRLLDVHHHIFSEMKHTHRVVETALWLSLLRACSGFEPFMKSHQGRVTGDAVAAFLLFEPRFPRSVRHCLESAWRYLGHLCPVVGRGQPGEECLNRLVPLVEQLKPQTLEAEDASVHALLTRMVEGTDALCASITRDFFGKAPAQVGTQEMAG